MTQKQGKEKTWHFTIERQSGITDEYFIKVETLYDAFIQYSKEFFPYNIVGLHITEAVHNESKEEGKRPGAGVS